MKVEAIESQTGYFSKGDVFEYEGNSLPKHDKAVITIKQPSGRNENWYASQFKAVLGNHPEDYEVVPTGYIMRTERQAFMIEYSDTIDLNLPQKVIDGWYEYWASKGGTI